MCKKEGWRSAQMHQIRRLLLLESDTPRADGRKVTMTDPEPDEFLARLGPARARRLFLTAETFDAELAEAWGLVDHTVPEEELDLRVREVSVHRA